jgi:hypothetical protein
VPDSEQGGGNRERRSPGFSSKRGSRNLTSVGQRKEDEQPEPASVAGRRVEIMLDDDLYDRVRIKAMRQRKSLRSLGAELFAAWADDESTSGTR